MTTRTANSMTASSIAALQSDWNAYLAALDTWEQSELGQPRHSDFLPNGELHGVSEHAHIDYFAGDGRYTDDSEPEEAGSSIDDFALLDDADRWAHEADGFVSGQRESEVEPYYGRDDLGHYLWLSSRERETRTSKLISWAQTAPLSALRSAIPTLRQRRNHSVARALGFARLPNGSWPGVQGHPRHGLVRRYSIIYTPGIKATVVRIPDWSDVYLTRQQLADVEAVISARLGE